MPRQCQILPLIVLRSAVTPTTTITTAAAAAAAAATRATTNSVVQYNGDDHDPCETLIRVPLCQRGEQRQSGSTSREHGCSGVNTIPPISPADTTQVVASRRTQHHLQQQRQQRQRQQHGNHRHVSQPTGQMSRLEERHLQLWLQLLQPQQRRRQQPTQNGSPNVATVSHSSNWNAATITAHEDNVLVIDNANVQVVLFTNEPEHTAATPVAIVAEAENTLIIDSANVQVVNTEPFDIGPKRTATSAADDAEVSVTISHSSNENDTHSVLREVAWWILLFFDCFLSLYLLGITSYLLVPRNPTKRLNFESVLSPNDSVSMFPSRFVLFLSRNSIKVRMNRLLRNIFYILIFICYKLVARVEFLQ